MQRPPLQQQRQPALLGGGGASKDESLGHSGGVGEAYDQFKVMREKHGVQDTYNPEAYGQKDVSRASHRELAEAERSAIIAQHPVNAPRLDAEVKK